MEIQTIEKAIESEDLIPGGYLREREVRPGAKFRHGPVVVSREWLPAVRARCVRTDVRTDNGPGLSSRAIEFFLPDGSRKGFSSVSGGFSPLRYYYQILEGDEPSPKYPSGAYPGAGRDNPAKCGWGLSSENDDSEVLVRFAGKEKAEALPWLAELLHESYAAGVNPLPILRKIYSSNQWYFEEEKGRRMVWFCDASPYPIWSEPAI